LARVGPPPRPRPSRDILLDTGPIVATLDPRDQWHQSCADIIAKYADRCVTSEAVLTEACYLAGRAGRSGAVAIDFLVDLDVPILSIETGGLRTCARLMDRYVSVPMDFADATIVAMAEALRIGRVITTDRRGFAAYRTRDGLGFRNLVAAPSPR
jgi:predicted nucleic acid-binding protein